jgi:uncharacterized RDD family membrane protein YckC
MQLPAKMSTERTRAGFCRRAVSLCIDCVIVFLPIQIIAAALFALTAGSVQFTGGVIHTTDCEPVSQIPQNLSPLPPANATEIEDCRVSWFGADTSRRLIVRRVTEDGNIKKTFSKEYTLDKNGNPLHAFSLDWIAYIALIAYFILAKARSGATLGDRTIGIKLIDVASSSDSLPSFKKLIVRYFVLVGPGALTSMLATDAYDLTVFGGVDQMTTTTYLVVWSVITILYVGFYLNCLVNIVARRDPIYDRIAGTAVVRRSA